MTNTTFRHDAVSGDLDEATGVITLTLAMPGRANVINASFGEGQGLRGLVQMVRRLKVAYGLFAFGGERFETSLHLGI